MAWLGSQFSTELESRLRDGLSSLQTVATRMGANSASVFLMKDGRTMRNLYMWPESGQERAEVPLERPLANALQRSAGYASQNCPAARFLQRAFQPESTSFFLFSWGMDRVNSVIAFGFAAAFTPERIGSGEIPCELGLASVAAWSVYEVFRLHSELAVVNDRLGARKLIEQAKGMLQAERGFDEQQAYAHLRKLSRQRRVRLSQVATDLLATRHFP